LGAVVVADVFHLLRLALQVLDEVRRPRQQQIHGQHRGHEDDPLFRLRRVLRVGQESLDERTVERISSGCGRPTPTTRSPPPGSRSTCCARCTPRPTGTPLTGAWSRSTSGPPRSTSLRWPGFAKTIGAWQDEVLAFFETQASNAPPESANVKIKSVRRVARGFKNTGNYRARILLHAGQPRRVPSTLRIRSYNFATAA
jgi:transposase